jgi:hypothetical protein
MWSNLEPNKCIASNHFKRELIWWDLEKNLKTNSIRTWLKPNDIDLLT